MVICDDPLLKILLQTLFSPFHRRLVSLLIIACLLQHLHALLQAIAPVLFHASPLLCRSNEPCSGQKKIMERKNQMGD